MVVMNIMFAFERQKKVVLPRDLSALTPRTIAGCCNEIVGFSEVNFDI